MAINVQKVGDPDYTRQLRRISKTRESKEKYDALPYVFMREGNFFEAGMKENCCRCYCLQKAKPFRVQSRFNNRASCIMHRVI